MCLREHGIDLVLDDEPQPFDVVVTPAVLEAMMIVADEPTRLTDDDLLDMISRGQLEPRVLWPNGFRRGARFAFVIHPLSQEFFTNVRPLGRSPTSHRGPLMDAMEKAMAYAPPFVFSHVTGITSPTGAEAEGWLITVGGTPKELMAHDPEFTYARLLRPPRWHSSRGAQVMGLGAFTKVVGDAGVTVAKRARCPSPRATATAPRARCGRRTSAGRRLDLAESTTKGG